MKELFNLNALDFATHYWDAIDFLRSTDVTAFTDTAVTAGGTALAQLAGVRGGWARSISGAVDGRGRNVQLAGGANAASTCFDVGKSNKFAFRYTKSVTLNGKHMIGLGLVNTTTLFATAAADFIGVRKNSASTALLGVLRQGGNEITVDLGTAFVAATAYNFLIEVVKTSEAAIGAGTVNFYGSTGVNNLTFLGKIDSSATVGIPANTRFVTPSWEFIEADASGALNFDVDAFIWRGAR